jgi:hypothetical protein
LHGESVRAGTEEAAEKLVGAYCGRSGAKALYLYRLGFRGVKAPAPSEEQGQQQIPPLRCGMTNKNKQPQVLRLPFDYAQGRSG